MPVLALSPAGRGPFCIFISPPGEHSLYEHTGALLATPRLPRGQREGNLLDLGRLAFPEELEGAAEVVLGHGFEEL